MIAPTSIKSCGIVFDHRCSATGLVYGLNSIRLSFVDLSAFIGNLYFMDGSAASSTGDPNAALGRPSQETLVFCSELLQVESPMILFHSLTERVMQMGKGSMVSIKLNKNQAEDTRDNLAKTLYSNLFDYIIKWVNTTLKTAESTFYSIGILDIFGFEGNIML